MKGKLIQKIVGVALGLTMAIGVGVAVGSNSASEAMAIDYNTPTNYNLSNNVPSGLTASTSLSKDSNGRGMGKAGATYTLTTSTSFTDVGKIVVNAATNYSSYSSHSVSATVGGSAFGSAQNFTAKASTSYTIEASKASGVVVVSLNNGKEGTTKTNTIWCLSIDIYTVSTPVQTYTVSFAVNTSGYGSVDKSSITNVPNGASISTSGNKVTINGTTVTATPATNTAQYTYAFTGWSNNTGTVTDNRTITANFSRTTNTFSVGGTIINGSLSNTAEVEYGSALNTTINPDSGYKLPSTLTSVTMGGSDYVGYSYNSSTGAFSITSVTGDVVIDAECPYDGQTYAINVSVPNGTYSGDSEIGEEGEASVTITPNSGYKVPLTKSDITVTNAIEWDYTRTSNSSATISLLGAGGVVSISATCVALNSYSINVTEGNHFTYSGPSSIQEDGSATLTFVPEEGYYQPSDVTVSGATKSWIQATGALTLSNPTGNVSITYTPVERTLTGITISSSSGSFTLGDTFTMPTVTATYNVGGNVDVTNDATATGDGLVDGILTKTGTKTITISYGGYSKTYEATVTAIEPSVGGLAKITKISDLTVGSTVYLVCEGQSKQLSGISTTSTKYGLGADYTTTPVNTYPLTVYAGNGGTGYAFKNSSDNYLYWTSGNSLNVNSDLSDNTSWTVSFNESGNALIANKADTAREIWWNTGSPRFACYTGKTEESAGYAPVQLYKNYPAVEPELKWITAEVKSGTYYQGSSVTSSDFTVTAHYNDGTTSTPTTDITVTNGELVNIGVNEVTLTYGGKSCKVNVTAIEQTATLTGLAWTQGEYVIIDGQGINFSELGTITAEYDNGDSHATKSINQCSVATYTKNGSDYVKATDLADGDTLTSTSHGKYLGISYTEGVVTKYAYSSAPIYVVEAIEDVHAKVKTTTWDKVTSLNVGDKVTFVNEAGAKVASGFDSNIITVSNYDSSVSTDFYFEVGKVGDYYTFHNANGYLGNHSTGTSGSNYAYLDAEIDTENNMNYFTVSFDEGNVVITSVYDSARKLQFNSTRFCFYGSNQSAVQLYKGTNSYTPTGEPISNTNAVAQKVVLEYADHFNKEMACIFGGTTANVATKWSKLAADFNNWFIDSTSEDFKNLTSKQVEHAFELFEYADTVEDGDTLQDMLARYEYIVSKYNKLGYNLEDFLHTNTDRPVVQSTSGIIGIFGNFNSSNMTTIIIVISLVSITAMGGYFFIRKRKEQ